jgi:hypothetical protein
VFTIDREYVNALLPGTRHHDLSSHHENLFARDRQVFPGINSGQSGPETSRSDDCHQNEVRIASGGKLYEAIFPGINFRGVSQPGLQFRQG